MYYRRKLKPDSSITGFIPAITCVLTAAIIWITAGPKEAFLSVSLFFVLYSAFSFWIYIRTRNISYVAASLWQFLWGVVIITRKDFPLIFRTDPRLSDMVFVIFLASTVWLLYLVFRKKAKWKGREVFELASMQIVEEKNGFTARPRPVGKAEYTWDELKGFAGFLRKNLVAMPFFEGNSVVFVPVKFGDEFRFLFKPDSFREARTWIAFDSGGNISVTISKKDYLDYRDELSFDQLCENLGKLFAEFMEYYRRGEADRIVYSLDELNMGFTS